jgi:hypothetical protein
VRHPNQQEVLITGGAPGFGGPFRVRGSEGVQVGVEFAGRVEAVHRVGGCGAFVVGGDLIDACLLVGGQLGVGNVLEAGRDLAGAGLLGHGPPSREEQQLPGSSARR